MRSRYFITFLAQNLVMITGIACFKLAVLRLGQEGFGEYAVLRRTLGFLYLPVMMGLGLSIPRYIAMSREPYPEEGYRLPPERSLLSGGVALTAFSLLLVGGLMAGSPALFGRIFFGARSYGHLAFPLWLTLVGLTFHALVFAYLRGRMQIALANLLQFIQLAFLPLISFLWPGLTVVRYWLLLGGASCAVAFTALILVLRKGPPVSDLVESVRLLTRYGIPRLPGELALTGLFLMPVTFWAHAHGVLAAGYLSFGISLLSLAGGLLGPIGLILLPEASGMVRRGAGRELTSRVHRVARWSLPVAFAYGGVGFLTAPLLMKVFFGAQGAAWVGTIRLLFLATIPYSLYVVMRSLPDAVDERPLNNIGLLGALALFLLATLAIRLESPLSLALAVCWLGASTAVAAWVCVRRVFTAAALVLPEEQRTP